MGTCMAKHHLRVNKSSTGARMRWEWCNDVYLALHVGGQEDVAGGEITMDDEGRLQECQGI